MSITIQCPNPKCQQTVSVQEEISGRNVKCRKCGTAFRATPTMDGQSKDTGVNSTGSDNGLFTSFPVEFGRYRILQLLGKGGMGAVYLAMDSQLNRKVALKIPFFNAKEEPKRAERFIREARSAASLHHPNICTVFDVGDVNGRPFITMAYIVGKPLEDLFDEDRLLPVDTAVEIIRKMALALQKAHDLSIVHRDLKPANVMITPDGEPVIMDFGLAKLVGETDAAEARLTKEGAILGTPRYMAPEQVNGDQNAIGPATDVYALGVMLFELLTGRPPYSGPLLSMLSQIASAPVPDVRQLRAEIHEELSSVCRKAMAKAASERFPGMSQFATVLSQCAAADGVSVTPAPVPGLKESQSTLVTRGGKAATFASLANRPLTSGSPTLDGKTPPSAVSQTGETNRSTPALRRRPGVPSLQQRMTVYVRSMFSDSTRIALLLCSLAGIAILAIVTTILTRHTSARGTTETATVAATAEDRIVNSPVVNAKANSVLDTEGSTIIGQSEAQLSREQAIANIEKMGGKIEYTGETHPGLISAIKLDSDRFTDNDLANLKPLSDVMAIFISSSAVTDAGLHHLEGLNNLRTLSFLQCTQIDGSGFEVLRDLDMLSSLILTGTRVNDAGLSHLEAKSTLEILNLTDCPITDTGLEYLKAMPKLGNLDLSGTKITNSGLKVFGGSLTLKELHLRELPITGDGLKWLSGANSIEFLALNDSKIDDAGLQYLSGLPAIQVIYLANTSISDAGLKHLKSLHRLRWLLLRSTLVTDAGLEHLKEMSSLEAVYVQNTAITEAGGKKLQESLPGVQVRP